MAGKIIADIIEAPAGRISLNVANVTVASINASGLYTSTGNLIISQANQIDTAAIVDGAVTDVKIEDGAVTDAKLTLAANASNIKTALNASGDAPIYAARAWVNFNGTGTVAIRASGNVTSITDNGTGDYTINFTTAMPDANYATVYGAVGDGTGAKQMGFDETNIRSTTQFRCRTGQSNSASDFRDSAWVQISIFR
jgi:hypothetical protein